MPLSFESVREQLLQAGIAPRHVSRYVVELREHLADLTERERRAGLDAKAADERACALIGSDAQLVQAMVEKTPRSMAVRAPWATFTLLPVLALLAAIIAIDASMIRLLDPVHGAWRATLSNSHDGLIAGVSFVSSYLVGPAIAAGCIVLAARQRLASRWMWIGLGLIAVISGLFGFYIHNMPAVDGRAAGTAYGAVPAIIVNGRVSAAATLSLVAVRAAVLFAIAALAFRSLRTHFIVRQ